MVAGYSKKHCWKEGLTWHNKKNCWFKLKFAPTPWIEWAKTDEMQKRSNTVVQNNVIKNPRGLLLF
jgi:hypothetical protein